MSLNLKNSIIFSILLHIILFSVITSPSQNKKDEVDISIIDAPLDKNKKGNNGSGSPGKDQGNNPKRIGSDGSGLDGLSLTEKISAENYIERIRYIIEPPWIRLVRDRIKFRNKVKYPKIKCTTSTVIQIDHTGFILSVKLLDSCQEDVTFDKIVLTIWDRNLPPPPKNLLINNLLELYWKFVIM